MILIIKCIFSMLLRGLQWLINSVFKLVQLPLSCPPYSYISKRTKTINIMFKKSKGSIQHLTIDFTGLKIYGKGE
ncbi:Mobile element protein [Candidatus Enterovibrio altilux]|uniref:Mobile element protein n=1 Tax=Candidatus Enterovibrio altilux TaxID=1927128 RepID=A0A291B897_9GAMM|nr:Mobile element protein [Candidatus Enterovibrio luxaltus]